MTSDGDQTIHRIALHDFGPAGTGEAARLFDATARLVAIVAAPAAPADVERVRAATWEVVLDLGAASDVPPLAALLFATAWGGGAFALT